MVNKVPRANVNECRVQFEPITVGNTKTNAHQLQRINKGDDD